MIRRAASSLLRPGGLVIHPTETVYGIGGRACDGLAALRIARTKGRPPGPLVVLVDGIPPGLPPLALALARSFWPGPLTLVVPAPPGFAPELLGPGGTAALRWTANPLALRLVGEVGPLSSSSANLHGRPPARRVEDLEISADALVDGGTLPGGPPSTIVDCASRRILRRGARAGELESWLARTG